MTLVDRMGRATRRMAFDVSRRNRRAAFARTWLNIRSMCGRNRVADRCRVVADMRQEGQHIAAGQHADNPSPIDDGNAASVPGDQDVDDSLQAVVLIDGHPMPRIAPCAGVHSRRRARCRQLPRTLNVNYQKLLP